MEFAIILGSIEHYLANGDFINTVRNEVNLNHIDFTVREMLKDLKVNDYFRDILIMGSVFNRTIILVDNQNNGIFIPVNSQKIEDVLPDYILSKINVNNFSNYISYAFLDESIQNLFKSPRIKLIGLFHQDIFPMPRFLLGLSYLAAQIRNEFIGKVELIDMQLDISLEKIKDRLLNEPVDILGIAITFGQQDLLDELLLFTKENLKEQPLIIVGGSLAFLNREKILSQYPKSIICNGPGEKTVVDLLYYWHGIIDIKEINNISYVNEHGVIVKSGKNELITTAHMELDLLPEVLDKNGIMLLETSRGCINRCTFCPRENKGDWYALNHEKIIQLMPFITTVFNNHTNDDYNRRFYIVDEEFFGRESENNTQRIKSLAKVLNENKLTFETSTRIDQVYNDKYSKEWHIERIDLWKELLSLGLKRCLFGVESGVESVLKRFGKNTKSMQNTIAIRLISAIGLPFRSTYITFDPLMNMKELIESYHYQNRDDIILKKLKLSTKELFDLVYDEQFVQENKAGKPLYSEIPYMLVSLECLNNSVYLSNIENSNMVDLVEGYNTSMGKRKVKYRDPRIGDISFFSQLWIDRNFTLNYLLKSIIKITANKEMVNETNNIRFALKKSSYDLLGKMLFIVNNNTDFIPQNSSKEEKNELNKLAILCNDDNRVNIFCDLINYEFNLLKINLNPALQEIKNNLFFDEHIFNKVYGEWNNKIEWGLINE